MRRLQSLLLGVLVAFAATAYAQTPLSWNLKDRFYAEVTSSLRVSWNTVGPGVDESRDLTFLFAVQPQAKSPDGTRIIDLTVESVKLTTASKRQAPKEEADFKKLEGSKLKVTLGPDLRVQQVEGSADAVKKVGGAEVADLPQQFRDLMQSGLDAQISFLLSELFVPLPEKNVQKGDQWKQKSTRPMPSLGTLALEKVLTYEGKGQLPYQNMECVTAKGKFTYTPAKGNDALPGIKILDGDVKSADYKGTLHFDSAVGRLVHAEVKMKDDVAFTAMIEKEKVQMQAVQEETLTIRTFDKKPAPK